MHSTDPVSSSTNCHRLIVSYTVPSVLYTQYTVSSSRDAKLSQLDLDLLPSTCPPPSSSGSCPRGGLSGCCGLPRPPWWLSHHQSLWQSWWTDWIGIDQINWNFLTNKVRDLQLFLFHLFDLEPTLLPAWDAVSCTHNVGAGDQMLSNIIIFNVICVDICHYIGKPFWTNNAFFIIVQKAPPLVYRIYVAYFLTDFLTSKWISVASKLDKIRCT